MEYELKFRAEKSIQARILEALSGNREEIRMRTTYFDTPNQALSARKWTLRCRQENDLSVCTLKTPGEGNARGEWETQGGEIQDSIEALCQLGAPAELKTFCREGLVPVCGAEFTRTAIRILYRESVLEVAIDQGKLVAGEKTAPIAEVEVELKMGSTEDVDAFAEALAREFSLEKEPRSKFARALALSEGE